MQFLIFRLFFLQVHLGLVAFLISFFQRFRELSFIFFELLFFPDELKVAGIRCLPLEPKGYRKEVGVDPPR